MGQRQSRNRGIAREESHASDIAVARRKTAKNGREPWATWNSPRAPLVAVAILVLAAVVAYSNSFGCPFILDDDMAIVDNPTIHDLRSLGKTFSPPGQGQTVTGRPLLNFSLAVNYAISGKEVWSYHVANLAIHLIGAILLFGILRRTFLLPSMRETWGTIATPLALAIALIWTIHPLQTESITYIVQRAESLVGLFYFLTLYCTIRAAQAADGDKSPDVPEAAESPGSSQRGEAIGWKAGAALACLCGMASKEVMVSAPLIVFLYDRTFLAGSFREAWRRRGGLYLTMAATWLLLGWLIVSNNSRGGSAGFGTTMSSWTYLCTQFGAIVHYLCLSFVPYPLVFDHGIYTASGAMEIVPYAIIVGLLGVATVVALWHWPKAGFLGAWFFAILGPTSSVVPVATQTSAEHRMYLPLAAVVTLAATGGVLACLRWSRKQARSEQSLRTVAIFVTVAIGLLFVAMTFQRNADYRSALSIWQDTVQKRPHSSRARNSLGMAYAAAGRWDAAVAEYRKAIEVAKEYEPIATFHNNLGTALVECGQMAEAIAQYEEALKAKPDYAQAYYNYGNAMAQQGKFEDAISRYRMAVKYKPDYGDALNNWGNVLLDGGHPHEAIEYYERALAFKPNSAETHCNFAAALTDCNRLDEAIEHASRALQLRPQYAKAIGNLQTAQVRLKDLQAAAGRACELAKAHPDNAQVLNEAARLLAVNPNASVRNGADAVALARRAVELSGGGDPAILDTLAAAYAEAGRFAEAEETAQKALSLAVERNASTLAEAIRRRLELYKKRTPLRESAQSPQSAPGT